MIHEQIIFTTGTMNDVRRQFYVGMEITVENSNIVTDKMTYEKEVIRIMRMYREFAAVTNGRYIWCVRYLDLLEMVHTAVNVHS